MWSIIYIWKFKLDDEFVRDSFNLYGLKELFKKYKYQIIYNYSEALGMILSDDIPNKKLFNNKK